MKAEEEKRKRLNVILVVSRVNDSDSFRVVFEFPLLLVFTVDVCLLNS